MFNHNRGLWGYTGIALDGAPLTVQSTGLGGPSAAIVVAELRSWACAARSGSAVPGARPRAARGRDGGGQRGAGRRRGEPRPRRRRADRPTRVDRRPRAARPLGRLSDLPTRARERAEGRRRRARRRSRDGRAARGAARAGSGPRHSWRTARGDASTPTVAARLGRAALQALAPSPLRRRRDPAGRAVPAGVVRGRLEAGASPWARAVRRRGRLGLASVSSGGDPLGPRSPRGAPRHARCQALRRGGRRRPRSPRGAAKRSARAA